MACSKRFTTYERIEEQVRLTVVKKDGSRVPWDRSKILHGLERACYKRPVRTEDLARVVDEVEEEIFKAHDKEVPSSEVGALVSDKLRRLDQVAYVRFSSVYRQFKTLDELVAEARAVIDAQHYDDIPGQGRLFIEPQGRGGRSEGKTEGHGEPNGNGEGKGRVAKAAKQRAGKE
jgi:transcriptional repressor NrdR